MRLYEHPNPQFVEAHLEIRQVYGHEQPEPDCALKNACQLDCTITIRAAAGHRLRCLHKDLPCKIARSYVPWTCLRATGSHSIIHFGHVGLYIHLLATKGDPVSQTIATKQRMTKYFDGFERVITSIKRKSSIDEHDKAHPGLDESLTTNNALSSCYGPLYA